MSSVRSDSQRDWRAEAPLNAMQAVIVAAEYSAYGRVDASSAVIADSPADPVWLRIAAVRCLASLAAGPPASRLWAQLRSDAHELAAQTGADDAQVRLALTAIALAEAFERGAIGRCDQLTRNCEFGDLDVAHAAATFAGHVVFFQAGEDTSRVFGELRRRYGVRSW